MLSPGTRLTLLDALRPPDKSRVGQVVGATYSLDLDAALIPLAAFAKYGVADVDSRIDREPLRLLDSVRRHADRYTVFFQTGQIRGSKKRLLYSYLEDALVEVAAPHGGVFHPKVWVLRFDKADGRSIYRVVCLSRNLTFDRSWDTILLLDGGDEPNGNDTGGFNGEGLAKFLSALPDLAIGRLDGQRRDAVRALADEVANVTWSLPPHVECGRFIPLGLDPSTPLPFPDRADQLAVISPFLTSGLLKRLPACRGLRVLISRPDQIDACARVARTRFDEIYTLHPDAVLSSERTPSDQVNTNPSDVDGQLMTEGDQRVPFDGLHAKVFIFDRGSKTTVFTGSANATSAAFEANVEFICELSGPRRALGVKRLMAESAQRAQALRAFLVPYSVADDEECEDETWLDDEEFEDDDTWDDDALEHFRRNISGLPLTACAQPTEGDSYQLTFSSADAMPDLAEGIKWRCWPITLDIKYAVECQGGQPLSVSFPVSCEEITAFLVNELRLGGAATRFVRIAKLAEAPSDRDSRVLERLLGDPNRFLSYLALLLSDEDNGADLAEYVGGHNGTQTSSEQNAGRRQGRYPPSLLERLLRALVKNPQEIETIWQTVEQLRSSPGGAMIPPGLLEILEPIWAATEKVSR